MGTTNTASNADMGCPTPPNANLTAHARWFFPQTGQTPQTSRHRRTPRCSRWPTRHAGVATLHDPEEML
eukprot:6766367-Lingulodinium_polyedra.AAC.1